VEERNQKVQSYFHLTAKQFDTLYSEPNPFLRLFNHLFRSAIFERSEKAIQECMECEASSVLDVGCGSGVNTVFFAQNGVSRVVGLDYAGNMLDIARGRIPKDLEGVIEYIDSDFSLWESDSKFDCVVGLGFFDYLDQPRVFLEKMARHAEKKVIFSVPGKKNLRGFIRELRYRMKRCPVFFYSKDELIALCDIPGFDAEIQTIGSSGYLCVLRKKEGGSS
jgi:ubiquinone/menaquinone biosynthesis C-methylase UbiE